jgi:hypothetical protein
MVAMNIIKAVPSTIAVFMAFARARSSTLVLKDASSVKRLPIGADNIAEHIAVDITAMATGTRLMAMPTQPTPYYGYAYRPYGYYGYGWRPGISMVSDVAGVGATNQQLHEGPTKQKRRREQRLGTPNLIAG